MKSNQENDDLLNDVFEEAPGLREDLFKQTVAAAQRRVRVRRWSRQSLVSACVVALLVVSARSLFVGPSPAPTAPATNSLMVYSNPLSPDAIVKTQIGSVELTHSSEFRVALVGRELTDPPLQIINDRDLLALLAGRPAALIHDSQVGTELLFVNPSDENGFPIQ